MTKLESNLFEKYIPENVQGILFFPILKSNLLIHPPLSSTKGQYSRWQATDLRVIQLVERGLTELYYSLPTWSGDLTAPVFSLCLRVCLIWVCVILEVVESFEVKLRYFFYKLLIWQPMSECVVPLAQQVHIGATFVGLDWSSKYKIVEFTEHRLNPILFVLLTWFKRMKWICIEEQKLGWFFVV